MKKTLLIITVLLSTLVSAQVSKIGTATINRGAKGDKGDTGIVASIVGGTNVTIDNTDTANPIINASGGSAVNASIKSVTNQTELIAALTGSEKELSIQSDFTLTSNVTIPDGAILSDGGGKITVGSYDVTFVNNSFKSDYLRAFIDIGASGTINDASTFETVDFDISWFGVVFDYDHSTGIGTDNFNTLRQVFKITNLNGGGKITALKEGAFAHNVVTQASHTYDTPTGVYMSGETHFVLGEKTIYQVLPSSIDSTRGFSCFETSNASVSGGLFRGDGKYWHTRETAETNHGGAHGVVISGKNDYLKFGSSISEWEGDCLIGKTNYRAIYSNSGSATPGDSNDLGLSLFNFQAAQGGALDVLISDVGVEDANTNWDTSKLYTIEGTVIETYAELLIGGNKSFQGESGFTSNVMYLSYYDTNDVFIERSSLLDIYSYVPLKPEYKKVRVSLPSIDFGDGSYNDFEGTIYATKSSKGIEVTSPIISWGIRQGISNLPAFTTIRGSHITMNGRRLDGTTSSPSYGVDLEDGYQMLNNVSFIECDFDNNAMGSIILKGSKYIRVINCRTNYNTVAGQAFRIAFSTGNGHYSLIKGNTLKNNDISCGRFDKYIDNMIFDSTFDVSFEGEVLKDLTTFNTIFEENKDGSLNTGVTYLDNIVQHFDRVPQNSAVAIRRSNFIIKNHTVDYNGHNVPSTGVIGVGGSDDIAKGSIDGFYVLNADVTGFESSALCDIASFDVNDLQTPLTCITFRTGAPRDCTLSNSSSARFLARPINYPTTNAGVFKTFFLENNNFITPSAAYISGGNSTFRTYANDFNIHVTGGKIHNLVTNTSGQSIFDLDHYGTAYFEEVSIDSGNVHTIDLTADATCGAITFKDCEFGTNITAVTLRVGDLLLFTKPNRLCPSYVDNAAALLVLPEGYYYKNTTTGKFDVTNL